MLPPLSIIWESQSAMPQPYLAFPHCQPIIVEAIVARLAGQDWLTAPSQLQWLRKGQPQPLNCQDTIHHLAFGSILQHIEQLMRSLPQQRSYTEVDLIRAEE
jgi:hypothetical protein